MSDVANGEGVKRSFWADLGRLEKSRSVDVRERRDVSMVGEKRARWSRLELSIAGCGTGGAVCSWLTDD